MKIPLRRFLMPLLGLLLLPAQALAQTITTTDKLSEEQTIQVLLSGYLYAAEGNYAKALPLIGSVGIGQKNAAVLASAVRIAIQTSDIAAAKEYADAWVEAGGGVQARQTQAELYIISGDLQQAEDYLAALQADNIQTQEDLLRQLSRIQDPAQAVEIARRLLSKDADGYYYLAQLMYLHSYHSEAYTVILQAHKEDNSRLDILFLAGRLSQLVEDDVAPLALMQQFADNNCGNALRHCSLDAVLWAFSNYLRGESIWRDALNADSGDAAEWAISAGNWYRQWEMPQQAQAAYLRGGGSFDAQLGLANIAMDEENYDEARNILKAAEVKNSTELASRETAISYTFSKQEQYEAALQRIQEAQKTLPDNFSLMYQHSLLLEQTGDIEAAVATLKRITELYPDNIDGWNALGYVMADNNIDINQAKQYIERAIQGSPNNPNYIDSLGWVYYRLGNLADARAQLKKAAALSQSAEIYAHYGEVLWESGDKTEARNIWRQGQQYDPDNKLLHETLERYNPF